MGSMRRCALWTGTGHKAHPLLLSPLRLFPAGVAPLSAASQYGREVEIPQREKRSIDRLKSF